MKLISSNPLANSGAAKEAGGQWHDGGAEGYGRIFGLAQNLLNIIKYILPGVA
jgi:hypothetical protein